MRAGIATSMAALAVGAAAQSNNFTCADGLFVLVARGTGEDPGLGRFGDIAERIAGEIDGSEVAALDYPAVFIVYADSLDEGAANMKNEIQSYAKACPGGKMAILGYSQGGQVAMDAVCGGSGGMFSTMTGVEEDVVEDNVVAVVVFGDPSHVANTTYDLGTSVQDGIFDRNDTSVCEDYSDRIASYCDTGDVYCDSGDDEDVHGSYFDTYADDVVNFVAEKYSSAVEASSATGSTPTPASTGTSTPSSTDSSSSGSSTDGSGDDTTGASEPTPVPTNAASSLAMAGSSVMVGLSLVMMAFLS